MKEIHDSWNYKQSGLGEGAALAVSIAATAAMPGIGTGLTGAMMTAAIGSLAGNGAVSLINNRGNLGGTLSDTFSSNSLKNALIAAASAGVSENLDSVWGGNTDPATGRTIPHDPSSWESTGRFAGQRASQALADAGLQSAISGGSLNDNLKQNLQGTVTTVLEASLFNQIGNLGDRYPEFLADGGSGKIALHALAGGLASQATGGDFRTGAIAAGANEALINQLDGLVKGDRKLLIAASQITGIVAAGMTDGDVQKGAEIAGNATAYNYLAHPEARRLQEINRLLEDDDNLTAVQRQSLEEERLAINSLSQSRDRALEQACGQGGTANACRYERAQLQVAMGSWQDVTSGREDQDTVFAEYIHTARKYGQNQQQRMERIGAEALSEMVVDFASAPFIMGTLVGQALQGDAESRALLQAMGEDIKAFAANPANYIIESNREQLARADALEQAGRVDDADRLRVRVALDNESMLMGAGGLVARLPKLAKNISRSKLGPDVLGDGDMKTTGNPVVDAEKEALNRIAQNPKADLTGKQSGTVLQAQSQKRIDDLAAQYNAKSIEPKDFQLKLGGKVLKADPQVSKGAPVYMGATTSDVMSYFKQLAGVESMPVVKSVPGKGTIYTAKTDAGARINLRDFSTSSQQTGASWTIDIRDKSINGGRMVEIKFK